MDKKASNLTYIAKVLQKTITSKEGNEIKVNNLLVDNPSPTKKDGSPDPYHKGELVLRLKSGEEYLIKQAVFRGVSDKSANYGFTRSLAIDLNDKYQVERIK